MKLSIKIRNSISIYSIMLLIIIGRDGGAIDFIEFGHNFSLTKNLNF
jgi:hypothetical protein